MEERFEQVGLDPEIAKDIKELKKLYADLLDLRQQEHLEVRRMSFVSQLKLSDPFGKKQGKQGYQAFSAPMSTLESMVTEVSQQASKLSQGLAGLRAELTKLRERIQFIHRRLGRVSSLAEQKWRRHVYVLVHSSRRASDILSLKYQIPNAFWHPSYDLRADLNRSKGHVDINLVSAGLVQQHTGENWQQVEMTLSSLDPSPLYLPRLQRWIFKEKRIEEPISESRMLGKASIVPEQNRPARQKRQRGNRKGKKDQSAPQAKEMASKLEAKRKALADSSANEAAAPMEGDLAESEGFVAGARKAQAGATAMGGGAASYRRASVPGL